MQKVLITGAGGMLGSSIKESALAAGWDFVAPTSKELDLRNQEETLNYLSSNKVTSIIHCAAKVGGIQANIDFPADFIIDNLRIDSSIINAARFNQVENFLYFASSCMYPKNNKQPMCEEDLLQGQLEPTNEGYAIAKIAATKSVESVAAQDKLNWKVLIPSNLYGPRDNFDPKSSHLVPAIIRKVSEAVRTNADLIEIWGSGKARREFTYVGDLANFVVNNFFVNSHWEPKMNIGIGIDYSINEYYETIGNLLNFQGKFIHLIDKPEGMYQKLLDSSIAVKHGWNPKTTLEMGLERTINWYRSLK